MSEASTPAAASLAEASEDPLRAPSAEDDAPLVMPAFRSLVALYTISFVSQMDGAVMLPTLWPFVEELCGRDGCQSDLQCDADRFLWRVYGHTLDP